jgi:hypothetical protein
LQSIYIFISFGTALVSVVPADKQFWLPPVYHSKLACWVIPLFGLVSTSMHLQHSEFDLQDRCCVSCFVPWFGCQVEHQLACRLQATWYAGSIGGCGFAVSFRHTVFQTGQPMF